MKIQFHKFSIFHVVIAAMTLLVAISCSTDEPNVPDTPKPDVTDTKGNISFNLTNDGDGSGSQSSPAVCHGTDPLHFTISQTSTYTDPNGSVFSCSPSATITLSARQDTLTVQDLQTLVTVNSSPDAQKSTTGNNPVKHNKVQTFDVGGQVITFDMMYEVYSHVNSAGTTIEMPYILLNNAKYGAAQTAEVAAQSAAPASPRMAVSGIRLTPREMPNGGPHRAKSVTTAKCYDVTVSFNMDIESKNTKTPQQQTLSFEVTYTAIVESTTEVPDPTTTLSYQTVVKQGSHNEASPFEVTLGETMHLQLLGTSQCSYFSMDDLESRVITRETTANVIVALGRDTVTYSGDLATLKTFSIEDWDVETSGTDPMNHTCRQIITLGGGQAIVTDWDYQSLGDQQVNDETVAMPWLQLEKPTVQRVTVSESDGKAEVTVRLRQDIKLMNLAEPRTETMEYIVRYLAVKEEPKLVKVTYRKDWEWIEAHDNLPLASYAMVYRDRTYSDGKTYTDTFRDYGRSCHWIPGILHSQKDTVEVTWDGGKVIYYPYKGITSDSYTKILAESIAVPDLEHVRDFGPVEDGWTSGASVPGNWEAYKQDILYTNLDLDLTGVTVDGQGVPSELESGWYAITATYSHHIVSYGYDPGFYVPGLRVDDPFVGGTIRDRFLIIDGMMFTFNEFIEPFEFNDKVEDFPGDANRGPGKIYTTEVRSRIMGKDFYAASIITFFTFPSSANQTAWAPTSPAVVTAPWSTAGWTSNWTQPTTSSWSSILTASHSPIPLRPHTAG